jgi:hypothetical protein
MSPGTSSGSGADLDAIVRDIAALRKDLATLIENVKTGATDRVTGDARRFYGALAAEGERSAAAIAQQVEERPLASLAIAFAVGFVCSRVLMR